jgi:hypothetical protein
VNPRERLVPDEHLGLRKANVEIASSELEDFALETFAE